MNYGANEADRKNYCFTAFRQTIAQLCQCAMFAALPANLYLYTHAHTHITAYAVIAHWITECTSLLYRGT